ncbi:hypothetical protein J6590_072666 [Homalodisca vitripennis]|nr:hypothetical protein J6590_072666 [Homalodisca vitripennis]
MCGLTVTAPSSHRHSADSRVGHGADMCVPTFLLGSSHKTNTRSEIWARLEHMLKVINYGGEEVISLSHQVYFKASTLMKGFITEL